MKKETSASASSRSKGGSIRQRPDGRWEARISLGFDPLTGKQRQKSFYGKTKEECLGKMDAALEDIRDGISVNEDPTLESWLNDWYQTFTTDLTYNTRSGYRVVLDHHLIPGLGQIKVKKLTHVDIRRFYNQQIKDGISAKYIRNIHSVLSSALKQAMVPPNALIRKNPADFVKLPRVEKFEASVLTHEQLLQFLDSAKDSWLYALWVVMVFSGMRRGEVCGLMLDDIDYDAHKIYIRRQAQRMTADNSPHGKTSVQLCPTKNKKGREVYCAGVVFDALREYLKLREYFARENELVSKSDMLFPNMETGAPLDPNSIYHAFKRQLKRAGLPDNIRLHDLRHTCATMYLELGADVKTIQEQLGHYSAQFTLQQYAHATDAMRQKNAEKISELLGVDS